MKQKLKSDIAKTANFAKDKNVLGKNGRFCKRQEVNFMQTLKTIVADKYFWLGVLLGFALGVLHHYYAL